MRLSLCGKGGMNKSYAVTLLTWSRLFTTRIEALDPLAARTRAKELYSPCLVVWIREIGEADCQDTEMSATPQ